MDGLPVWASALLPLLVVAVGILCWALVDALLTPVRLWHDAELPKYLWISIIWYSFGIGAVVYLVKIRPQLRPPKQGRQVEHP